MNHQYFTSLPASYLHFYNNPTYSALLISVCPVALHSRSTAIVLWLTIFIFLSVSVKKLSDLDGDEEQAFNRYSDEEAWQV